MTESAGFVKVFRKLLENPIWTQLAPAVGKVAIHFLLRANYKPSQWYDGTRTTEIPAGSFITSYHSMARECNISVQQTRDAFLHLARTQFATYRATHRWTMVTVLNWSTYQAGQDDENTLKNTLENKRKNTPENRQGTPDKEVKKEEYLPLSPKGGMNGVSSNPDELPFATLLDPLPPETGNGKNHSAKGAARNGNGRAPAISDAIKETAERIHARHPRARRDIGVEQVGKKLAAIVKHRRVPIQEQEAFLEQLDRTHAATCASEAWSKDGGQFAKSLENWLAPTKERYLAEPTAQSTSGVGYQDMDDWKKGIVQ